MKIRQKPPEKVWEDFKEAENLTDEQLALFQKYANYLLECNELFNLTAITDLSGVVRQHFQDSLALAKFVDMTQVKTIADIGTGGGFPGVPLKIMYPHLNIVLMEVTRKKQDFLADVVKILGLENVTISGVDWRTFLRTTNFDIDMFVTRAALNDLELSRMFKPGCVYKNATLVYWASKDWEPHVKIEPSISKVESYRIGNKDRRLIFMRLPKAC